MQINNDQSERSTKETKGNERILMVVIFKSVNLRETYMYKKRGLKFYRGT